ncbi:hypothetical protein [Halorubrum sp. N11]|uniref:hypothetical protein n=1 Tax=Halorubrum sp. N11 TaxID=3402276 RepID=UPI003EBC2D6E
MEVFDAETIEGLLYALTDPKQREVVIRHRVCDTLRLLGTVVTAGINSVGGQISGFSHLFAVKKLSVECTVGFEEELDIVLTRAQVEGTNSSQIDITGGCHEVREVVPFRFLRNDAR